MSAPENMWSRRRAAVQAEAEADERAVVEAQVAQERAELEEKSEAGADSVKDYHAEKDEQRGSSFGQFKV